MKLSNKIVCLFMVLVALCGSTLYAQKGDSHIACSGVYLNAHDYVAGKLSYATSCSSSGKIKLNNFLASRYITVTVDGKKTRLNKDSIYGYRNCNNETYRFFKKHDEVFQILEANGITVYSSYVRITSNNGKANRLEIAYFFSKTIDSEIVPLTVQNLKHAFPDVNKLNEILSMKIGSSDLLSDYATIDSQNVFK